MSTVKDYPHQEVGLQLLQRNPHMALFWYPGNGKTKAILDDLAARKARGEQMGGLVFAPNNVKDNWVDEVERYVSDKLSILVPDGPSPARIEQIHAGKHDIYVLNYESLVFLRSYLITRPWPFLVADESTKIKNPQAASTKTALQLQSPLRRILTGLPDPNDVAMDLYTQMNFVSAGQCFPFSAYKFRDFYCVMGGYERREIVGYKNLDDLARRIAPYVHQVGEEALGLPERIIRGYPVPLTGETLQQYEEMRDSLRAWWGNGDELKARLAVTQLMRLAQIAGGTLQEGERHEWIANNPKIKALDDVLEDSIYRKTDKAVVFGIYKEELRQIHARYPKLKPLLLWGDNERSENTAKWRAFQEKGNPNQLMVAQTKTGGIGINLFAARNVIFYTRDFSLESYIQGYKRVHRGGQTGTVRVTNLISKVPEKPSKRVKQPWDAIGVDPLAKQRKHKSIDEIIDDDLTRKERMAKGVMSKVTKLTFSRIKSIMEDAL